MDPHVNNHSSEENVSTQTEEEDSIDYPYANGVEELGGSGRVSVNGHFRSHSSSSGAPYHPYHDQLDSNSHSNGFLSNLVTLVLPKSRKSDWFTKFQPRRTIATQTEDQDPISSKGGLLCFMIIQELATNTRVNYLRKDDVYESLFYCVCEILEKHSLLFNGMVIRIQVTHYQMFSSVANELFEANANNETGQLRISWGRIVSLFAFAVRLAQHYHEDEIRVEEVTNFLSQYLNKHVIPWIRDNGGWQGLVDHFPPPVDGDAQFRKAVIWSGLCVGLLGAMYVSTFMKH